MKTCFFPSNCCLTPPSQGTPYDINAIYTSLKSAFSGLQFRRWQYGSIFIRLPVIASKAQEMSQNSKRIWPYSSSKSYKVINLGVNGKPICDFLLVIVTLAVSATVLEIFVLKDRKLLILPTPPLFDAPARGSPQNVWMKLSPQKLDGSTVLWKFHILYLQLFLIYWQHKGENENRQFCLPWPWNQGQGSLKVIDFGTNGKRVYTFLLVINSNCGPILHHFGVMAA